MASQIVSLETKPSVVIFSEVNILSIHLVDSLLANHCIVNVFTEKAKQWVRETAYLKDNNNLKIFKLKNKLPERADYVFIIEGIETAKNEKEYSRKISKRLSRVFSFVQRVKTKTYVFLPYVQTSASQKLTEALVDQYLQKLTPEPGIVFLGQLYGPKMYLSSQEIVGQMIKEAISGGAIRIPEEDFPIFPLFVGQAVKELIGAIFSYGFAKKKTALVRKTTVYKFLKRLQQIKTGLSFIKVASMKEFPLANVSGFVVVKKPDKDFLKQTFAWFARQGIEPEKLKPEPEQKRITPRLRWRFSFRWRQVAFLFLLFLWLLILPFVSMFASGAALTLAYRTALKGRWDSAQVLLNISEKLAVLAKQGMLIERLNFMAETASVLQRASLTGKRGIVFLDNLFTLVNGIFSDQEYDIGQLSKEMVLELEFLYQEISFLESEIDQSSLFGKNLLSQGQVLREFRKYMGPLREIAGCLPLLLGSDRPKTYLVLFQNNMELRPTGGFIGSFALVTFDKGRLIDMSVLDVYSADGQLKGHVEPPVAIRDYLGEANWFLRDSNWDPDFPTSARRAEWFLEKEIDRKVDGVVAIDLELVKSFLKELGPVRLPDFGQEIDYKNVYEKIQYEVESEFFPGSHKKANFLTALVQVILTKLTNLDSTDYLRVGRILFENLETQHIQIFVDNTKVNQAVSLLNWDGAVKPLGCKGNCAVSWLVIIEANVGVNKVNYFIERRAELFSVLSQNKIDNRLTIDLQNNAPAALDITGRYKVYIRTITTEDSFFDSVKIISAQAKRYLTPEIKKLPGRLEAGVLLTLAPGQKKSIIFSWHTPAHLDFSRPGKYLLGWQKQSGTDKDPIIIKLAIPRKPVRVVPGFSLTDGETFGYNTNLLKDFSAQIDW